MAEKKNPILMDFWVENVVIWCWNDVFQSDTQESFDPMTGPSDSATHCNENFEPVLDAHAPITRRHNGRGAKLKMPQF